MTTVSPEFIAALRDVSVFTPELPETAAIETLERIEAYERAIVLAEGSDFRQIIRADYEDGAATDPDELRVFGEPRNPVLLTAEHATTPCKQNIDEPEKSGYITSGADQGTGGLAALLAEGVTQSIVPIGRQTANVANAPDTHPLKIRMSELFPTKVGFVSLHGMLPGKLTDIADRTEIHAILGLGPNPSELSRSVAESIVAKGRDYNLRAVIGNDVTYKIHDPATDELKLTSDGQIKTGQLKAYRQEMTTNYAYRLMAAEKMQIPSIQIELTRALRLLASDAEHTMRSDKKARAMGVYLGYLFVNDAVELMAEQGEK